MDGLNPITRREVFLAAASGEQIETPEPITREEMYLKKIAEGGGGSDLPDTPAEDGTYALQNTVEGGESTLSWVSGGSSGGVLVVGVTLNSQTNLYECNKTAGEIWAAFKAGSNVVFSDTEYDEAASLSHAYVDSGTYYFYAAGTDATSAWMAFTAESSTDNPVQEQGE